MTWNDHFAACPDLSREILHWWLADRMDCGLLQLPLSTIPCPADREAFTAAVPRLRAGEPVQYVCGRAPFRDFVVAVDKRVLIPRPETEELVDLALRHAIRPGCRILDVGCGSGCIALALKRARPDCHVEGVDLSADALDVARANAARLALDIPFRQANLLAAEADASWDLLIANLPYIGENEHDRMDPWVLAHEPHLALFAGPDGSDLVLKLMDQARRVLAPGGRLLLETGDEQTHIYPPAATRLGWNLLVFNDLAGKPRFWILTR